VSGLPCIKRAGHREREREREREAAGGGGDEEGGGGGEEEECSSGLEWLGVSGCGKRRRMRRDPFTLWEANDRFYQECAAELDGMFRVHIRSTYYFICNTCYLHHFSNPPLVALYSTYTRALTYTSALTFQNLCQARWRRPSS
jgi:hypothetical protein